MVNPYHWTDMPLQLSVIDVRPDLKISNTERGLFFQISLDNYVPALAQLKLANDNNLTLITTEKDIVKIPKKYHFKIKCLKMKIEFDKNDLISLRLLLKQKLND